MYLENKKLKNVASILLLLAIILPSAIQFSHFIEGHNDNSCAIQIVHLHKTEKNCDTCDFHFTSFNFDISKYEEANSSKTYLNLTKSLSNLLIQNSSLTNNQLRAPPTIS